MAGAGQPKLKVLIRRAAIQKRVREVAQRITKDFKGERVHVIGVLKGACIFLSDLVPMTAHLPLPWIMGLDSYPLTTLANKKKWLPLIVREGWLALFCHDGKIPAAHLREQLCDAGLLAGHIHDLRICTRETPELPSHRRSPDGSRFACLAALR